MCINKCTHFVESCYILSVYSLNRIHVLPEINEPYHGGYIWERHNFVLDTTSLNPIKQKMRKLNQLQRSTLPLLYRLNMKRNLLLLWTRQKANVTANTFTVSNVWSLLACQLRRPIQIHSYSSQLAKHLSIINNAFFKVAMSSICKCQKGHPPPPHGKNNNTQSYIPNVYRIEYAYPIISKC